MTTAWPSVSSPASGLSTAAFFRIVTVMAVKPSWRARPPVPAAGSACGCVPAQDPSGVLHAELHQQVTRPGELLESPTDGIEQVGVAIAAVGGHLHFHADVMTA